MDSILIVDDEKDNLEALQRLLRGQYDLALETSPFEAFKLVQKKEFSVIVSDQRMPEMTGVELFEKVQNISPDTTRILLTGYTDMRAVVDAVNRGQIYRYISKPWDPDDLRVTLRQAADAFRLRKQLEIKNRALTKSNEELKNALDSLRLLDKAKAKFLSLISHELNTPLTVLISFTELLKLHKGEFSEDIKTAVDSLCRATDRFSEIVNEVLLYVKLESDDSLHFEKFDLATETKALAIELGSEIKAKNLKFAFKSKASGELQCDPQKIRVALEKLLRHTISHSPEGETFKVTVGKDSDWVTYTVNRLGPAISKEAFDSLIPTEQQMHHRKDIGLALAICRLIVQAHQGEIRLDQSDESGTQITIALRRD